MVSGAEYFHITARLEADTKYSASKLYEAYRQFYQALGRKPQSINAFKKTLENCWMFNNTAVLAECNGTVSNQ